VAVIGVTMKTKWTEKQLEQLRLARAKRQTDWTEPELEILRINYIGYGAAPRCQRMIRDCLGRERSLSSIWAKIATMGLQMQNVLGGRLWTEQEDEFLRQNAQKHSIAWLSENLPTAGNNIRRPCAITRRCHLLKVNRNFRDDWYCCKEVAKIFGTLARTIVRLADEGLLKGTKRNGEGKYHIWEFQRQALKTFILTYPEFLNGRRCDMVQIIDIVSSNGIKYKAEC
jgi:hypothetical protein